MPRSRTAELRTLESTLFRQSGYKRQSNSLESILAWKMLGLMLSIEFRYDNDPNRLNHSATPSYQYLFIKADSPKHQRALKRLDDQITKILKASDATDRVIAEEQEYHKKGGHQGFSRNPFHQVAEANQNTIALAIMLYLYRGYASFFGRSRNDRDYNVAMTALNDFHQAYQLSWRLYNRLSCSHNKKKTPNLDKYFGTVESFSGGTTEFAGASAYFTWSTLILCQIMRGNVYRQLGYLTEADWNYRDAQARFDNLCEHSKHSKDSQNPKNPKDTEDSILSPGKAHWFLTPTFVQALYRRSKTRFDLGQFLESLIMQIECLLYLMMINTDAMLPDIAATLSIILAYLKAERTMPIINRKHILARFSDPSIINPAKPTGILDENNRVTVEDMDLFYKHIPPYLHHLAVQIMARIGFTLYTIRPKPTVLGEKDKKWLNKYFAYDKVIKDGVPASDVAPSHLGRYCQAIIGTVDKSISYPDNNDYIFADQIDRKYALLLRSALPRHNTPFNGLDEPDYYDAVYSSTTENIGNIVTIPRRNRGILMRRGYKRRRSKVGDLGPDGPRDKIVVLRRWQSYNPRIPRAGSRKYPGGGYFLLWKRKGIVIDPGYDFIQNFYAEGFSLEDIDTIIVTHAHPDHDDEFTTLTALVKEWNDYHYATGAADLVKRNLVVMLNESTHNKFCSWVNADKVNIGRVILLPCGQWNKSSTKPDKGPFRGNNVKIDLRRQKDYPTQYCDSYNMVIEVMPAWHDDIVGRTSAIGLKFHLYDESESPVSVVGYTGDTGAYSLDIMNPRKSYPWAVSRQYADCDVLIAHLGDIRLRELDSALYGCGTPLQQIRHQHPRLIFLRDWFAGIMPGPKQTEAIRHRVIEYLNFIITLDLVPRAAFEARLHVKDTDRGQVQELLGKYINGDMLRINKKDIAASVKAMYDISREALWQQKDIDKRIATEIEDCFIDITSYVRDVGLKNMPTHSLAFHLLGFLTVCGLIPWQYPNHLGIFGMYKMFLQMARLEGNGKRGKVFIVGELPEELASYRHRIAWLFNRTKEAQKRDQGVKPVYAFTGDIGLHVALDSGPEGNRPTIRCTYCNYNNETVRKKDNYRPPQEMTENCIKRSEGAMIYLCKDHYPGDPDSPQYFLSRPYLRFSK